MTAAKKTKADETIRAEDVREASATAATKVADGAREFVRRSALTAKERTDNAYESVEQFNDNVESTMNRAVGGYVSILDGVAKAAHEDVTRALNSVEQLASAKSVSEAVSIQTTFIRENTTANIDRVRTVFGYGRDMLMDGAAMVRENVSAAMPSGKKAA
ncbi:MAG: phasin family protein [Pseudomonadota bacterium]